MIKQFFYQQFDKVKWFKVLQCITNNSIKHQLFVYTQLNDQIVIFQTIQFSISHFNRLTGLVGRVFVNSPGDRGSIPGRVIPKTFKKWYLIPHCLTLSIIRYVSRVKWSNLRKGVALSPTRRCSSY